MESILNSHGLCRRAHPAPVSLTHPKRSSAAGGAGTYELSKLNRLAPAPCGAGTSRSSGIPHNIRSASAPPLYRIRSTRTLKLSKKP